MASEKASRDWSGEVKELLVLSDRLAGEAGGLLETLSTRLGDLCRETAPTRLRAKTLSHASQNIRKARMKYDGLLSSLDMSRRQGRVIARGPAREQLDAFLTAVKNLSHAIKVLKSNQHLACVRDALGHARQVFSDGMRECETNFATTLSQHSKPVPIEILSEDDPELELVSPEAIPRLQILGETMLEGGHDGCARVYVEIRSQAVEKIFSDLGLREFNGVFLQYNLKEGKFFLICHIMKRTIKRSIPNKLLSYEQFERKIQGWIRILYALVVVLSEEKKIAQEIFFTENNTQVFSQVVDGTLDLVIQMCQELVATKHVHEKLFALLDMHLHMQHLIVRLDEVLGGTPSSDFVKDVKNLMSEVANASSSIFKEYQESVRADASKKEISDGTVHPICASVMAYFKRLLRHGNFLRVLFKVDQDGDGQFTVGNPMSTAMAHVLMVLQGNLEGKSKSCKSAALAALFMMNNVQFMLQSVEQSKACMLLGESWINRHRQVVEDHRQQYFNLTWQPLINNLIQHVDDLNLASQQKKSNALKERFKTFNKVFSDINATQCQWTVPDAGLKSAVKQSIVAEVIPAYAVFCGVMETITFTKNRSKYFKFTVEQVQQIINEDLLENKYVS